jgi:hypothetical protein
MSEQAILPELERRRWILAIAVAGALLVAGGAAAATHVLLESGETAGGTFTIESKRVPAVGGNAPGGSICLQLTFSGRGSAYGCGSRPTESRPFGLVIADPLDGGDERVVYGLVSEAIARVNVRGARGSEVETETQANEELWGRFFSMVAPNDGPLQLIGYGADGEKVASLGSTSASSAPPLSKAEAMEQGDPAGFAPGVTAPHVYIYKGEVVDEALAQQLELACLQERAVFRCYDSEAEMESDGVRGP